MDFLEDLSVMATTVIETETKPSMEISAEQLLMQLKALHSEVKELRVFSERQQDSISSLIALSQHHSTVIEQQNALIRSLTVGEGAEANSNGMSMRTNSLARS